MAANPGPSPLAPGAPRSLGSRSSPRQASSAVPVFAIGPGRNRRPVRHRNGRRCGSSGGKRRPEPHGHKSFRPSLSTSSVSVPTMRLPRLTRDSLEGTPGGACWPAQKDAAVSWSRSMIVPPWRPVGHRIVASTARLPRAVFRWPSVRPLEHYLRHYAGDQRSDHCPPAA